MSAELTKYEPTPNSVVVYQSEDGTISLDVQLSDETVWLTQQQMADLFQKDQSVIARHIANIFKEGELEKSNMQILHNTYFKYRPTAVYNLDVIISVGYRVKSNRGVQFRRWANRVLKSYLLNGYAINQRLIAIEERMDRCFIQHELRLNEHQQKIDFFVKAAIPPLAQIFYNGEFFEARVFLEKLIKTATRRIVIIDNYIDTATFEMLDVRKEGVTADIYSGKDYFALRDLHKAKPDTAPINTHLWSKPSHDRWLLIDDIAYHCGHSLNPNRSLDCFALTRLSFCYLFNRFSVTMDPHCAFKPTKNLIKNKTIIIKTLMTDLG